MTTVATCPRCRGDGTIIESPCSECRGSGRTEQQHTLTAEIPAGVESGSRLRLRGRGAAGPNGSPPGDLYVELKVVPDERFERDGDHLRYRLAVGVAEAALGTEVDVPLIDGGEARIAVEPGTQPGETIRLPGKGMGRLRRRGRGDLLVDVDVRVPADLTAEQEAALREYARLRDEQPAPARRRRRRR